MFVILKDMTKKKLILCMLITLTVTLLAAAVLYSKEKKKCETSATYFSTHPNFCPAS